MVFPVVMLWMWELHLKEGWAPKNWLENTLESPLYCKDIKPVSPKRNQPWMFIGRTEAEAPILWLWGSAHSLEKIVWCWERLWARGEGGDRGWDVFMVSVVQDREAWCAAVLWIQRVAHKLEVEQQQTEFQSEGSKNARGTSENCRSSRT